MFLSRNRSIVFMIYKAFVFDIQIQSKKTVRVITYVCTVWFSELDTLLTATHLCATKYFWKKITEVCSPHLYASFGTPCVQIVQLFKAQWVFKHSEEFRNRRHFPSIAAICQFPNILQRLALPRIIDQFGRKRCQKKRKDVDYQLL